MKKDTQKMSDLKRLEFAIEALALNSGGKFSRAQAQILMQIITKMIYQRTE